MAIFKQSNQNLEPIKETKIDLEKDIQKLTEQNLDKVFGLRFVCGKSNQEFCVRVNEQDFYIDTVALDESTNSVVLIEYKKDKSFSVIDQGFAYLAAMLSNKAEFVLEINERLGKSFSKKNIDWEQSRIIFISNEFTNYQKNAINFKDLPMYLYEVKVYDGLVDYNPIKAYRTSESINKFIKDKKVQKIANEVKVFSIEDHLERKPIETVENFHHFRNKIFELGNNVLELAKKYYICYRNPKINFVSFHVFRNRLQIDLIVDDNVKDPKKILRKYPSSYGYAKNLKYFDYTQGGDFDYAMDLVSQAYDFNNGRWE